MAGYWFSPQPLSYFTYLKRIFWRPNGFCGVADQADMRNSGLDHKSPVTRNILEESRVGRREFEVVSRTYHWHSERMAINIMCRIQYWELAWTQRYPCIYIGEKMLARVQKTLLQLKRKLLQLKLANLGATHKWEFEKTSIYVLIRRGLLPWEMQ